MTGNSSAEGDALTGGWLFEKGVGEVMSLCQEGLIGVSHQPNQPTPA
jgi:hypothetical protein